ncbi:MAG TPA: extradiol ring-cleavage dioxygenase [Chloroflexota bacterium]|nr:extradiol ring-cleavage dioxygenase [Chloroflexota bacterium]
MGQILGLGITHYPGLAFKGNLAGRINLMLGDPALPDRLRSVENWPEPMRRQWSDDEGRAHSDAHRQAMIEEFRKAREELDAFHPDFVVIWGDDQYENFREDCVPAFSVLAYDTVELQPWHSERVRGANSWDEPADATFAVSGHRDGGKYLATSLLRDGFDIAYAYKPLHARAFGHAIANSILYLDWDRRGFAYPVVPITVNSYGRALIAHHGRPLTPTEAKAAEGDEDPPGPQPWRCFQLGASVARAAARSPWRVALIASSSWSHSFLVPKHAGMYPDVESDKRLYEAFVAGDWDLWRNTTIDEAEDRGHQELLNWYCLAGAMAELGRKPDYSVFQESWITNSDKVFAVFRP